MDERAAIALLRSIFGGGEGGGGAAVEIGIGDDAAVLQGGLVWTVDAQVEGTHFRPAWLSWKDVGWRSFMAAASDVAAMGATPIAALSALVLAPTMDDAALAALARGQAAAAAALGAPVSGGNLARGSETSITTTVLGRAAPGRPPMRRGGARAGDALFLAGAVGLAAAGLAALERAGGVHGAENMQDARIAPALAAWRRPVARVADGLVAAAAAHAAIDVSDGLARDASHVAEASGVRLVLDARALVSAELRVAAAALGEDPLALALGGGEDYALLVAAPESAAPALTSFARVGAVEELAAGAADATRVWLADGANRRPIEPRGFDHFARRP